MVATRRTGLWPSPGALFCRRFRLRGSTIRQANRGPTDASVLGARPGCPQGQVKNEPNEGPLQPRVPPGSDGSVDRAVGGFPGNGVAAQGGRRRMGGIPPRRSHQFSTKMGCRGAAGPGRTGDRSDHTPIMKRWLHVRQSEPILCIPIFRYTVHEAPPQRGVLWPASSSSYLDPWISRTKL